MHDLVPPCYFPTTVVMIDDNASFLSNFCFQANSLFPLKLYESPYQALHYIHQISRPEHLLQQCASLFPNELSEPQSNLTLNIDFLALAQELQNTTRFAEVSVIVVDYLMPGINGLDLCRKLAGNPIKKLMLTGHADEKIAVEAFNEGLFDAFIPKGTPNVLECISETIANLQFKYFHKVTELITSGLMLDSTHFVADPLFAKFFYELCEQHQLVEFYLVEKQGCFLMLDASGNFFWLWLCKRTEGMHNTFAKQFQIEWTDWDAYLYTHEEFAASNIHKESRALRIAQEQLADNAIVTYDRFLNILDPLATLH